MQSPPSGAPASPGQIGGALRQTPDGGATPPTHALPSAGAGASGRGPASRLVSPASSGALVATVYWQYSPLLHPLESRQLAPGVTHFPNEQRVPVPQHTAPHACEAEQHVAPTQTPPSPHACPVLHEPPPAWPSPSVVTVASLGPVGCARPSSAAASNAPAPPWSALPHAEASAPDRTPTTTEAEREGGTTDQATRGPTRARGNPERTARRPRQGRRAPAARRAATAPAGLNFKRERPLSMS